MKENTKVLTWDELMMSINQAVDHPGDTAWHIYYYMDAHMQDMNSQEARTMLATYMKIPVPRPSLIHSCMLRIAIKMAGKFMDFRYAQFLKLWGYPSMLREEDKAKTVKDGKTYMSLKERVEYTMQSYLLHHDEERPTDEMSCIKHMVAVKLFDTQMGGRKVKTVKLVGTEGDEMFAVSALFKCRHGEIQGKLYDVLIRHSEQGVPRVKEVVPCKKDIAEVFPVLTGFVEYIDNAHGHYHVYDCNSRHFVALNPQQKVNVGDFVTFSPVIPNKDKFKSAVVVSVLSRSEGLRTFGMKRARITFVDEKKGYAAWQLEKTETDQETVIVETGTHSPVYTEGYISLAVMETAGLELPAVNDMIDMVVFLKRGKDGVKRPYVVYYEKLVKV